MIDAIKLTLSMLGPREWKCPDNNCQGCQYDRKEAIDILTRALEDYEKEKENAL